MGSGCVFLDNKDIGVKLHSKEGNNSGEAADRDMPIVAQIDEEYLEELH